MTVGEMMAIGKDNLDEASKKLSGEDLVQLVDRLSLKEDRIRYQAFLLVQSRSKFFADVYPYWGEFLRKAQKRQLLSAQHRLNADGGKREMG